MSVPPFNARPSSSSSAAELREFLGWRMDAACAGLPPQVVFARRPADAAPALRACARCPVTRECEEAVDPARTWFDGVSAGRLWHNGRPVDLNRGNRARAQGGAREAEALAAGPEDHRMPPLDQAAA
ncbi:WhiB family transcriptional regulator [Streptomyces sp. NPDC045431]|uniref:WhiB family transcriptional regulator n=1 Tax=Streptomyces sp. NPDC045431 TaxID=3155613 RepID=UPI0033CDC5E8